MVVCRFRMIAIRIGNSALSHVHQSPAGDLASRTKREIPFMSLSHDSYLRIRESLLAGDDMHGERFSINDLSKRLGIGRSPVRDAVNRLAAEGLLQPVAKSGVVVRSVSFEELLDIVGLREAVEPYAAAQACPRMDYDQRRRLHSLCMEMRRLARQIAEAGFADEALHRKMQKADWAFHRLILEASGNRILCKLVEDHRLLMRKARYPSLRSVAHLARTLLEHWRICRALSKGDAESAKAWMLRHAKRGGNAILEGWREVHAGGSI